jgi:hypothetical protein
VIKLRKHRWTLPVYEAFLLWTRSRKNDEYLNQKFGKDTVLLGMTPHQGKAFTGTKIAFTRIPDMEEFWE